MTSLSPIIAPGQPAPGRSVPGQIRRAERTRRRARDGGPRQAARWLWRSPAARAQLVVATLVSAVLVGTFGIWLGSITDHSEFASAAGEPVLGDSTWTLALYLAPASLAVVFPVTLAMQLPELRVRRPGVGRAVAARSMAGAVVGLIAGVASSLGAGFGGILALTIWGQPLVVFHGNAGWLLLRMLAVTALFGVLGALLSQIFSSRRSRYVLVIVALVVGIVVEPVLRITAIGSAALARVVQWLPGALAEAVAGSAGPYRAIHVAAEGTALPVAVAAVTLVATVLVLAAIAALMQRRRV